MTSDGMARRCFCYLTDATIAFIYLLTYGKSPTSSKMNLKNVPNICIMLNN